jgi:hypothetical protein
MMLRVLPCALLALLSASAGAATITTVPDAAIRQAIALRDQAATDKLAYELLESLTTEIGPRLAGGVNDQKARDWAVAKFKALGYDKVWTEPVTFPKWVRRSESASLVAPFAHHLAITALGYSPATPKGGLTADIVLFDSLKALQAATPDSVKGKIVFVSARMRPHKDGHDYGIGGTIRGKGPAIAAKLGAAALVLRSAGTDNHRLPHTGVTQWDADGKRIPAAAVSNPDADLIEATLRRGQPVRMKLQLDCGVEGDYTGANVIAEITGSEKPDEVVIMGGHLDSWAPVRSTTAPASRSAWPPAS